MSFDQFVASLQAPALAEIARHWNAVRRGRRMPAWRDIDPAALRRHLHIIWAWRSDPERATLVGRLAGQTIVDAIGLQIRGRRIEDCFPPEAAPVIRERFDRVMAGPRLMRSAGRVYVTSARHGSGERISLPLSGDGTSCDGIIGATVYTFDRPVGQDERIENDEREEEIEFFEFLT